MNAFWFGKDMMASRMNAGDQGARMANCAKWM